VNDYPIPMAPIPPATDNVPNKPIHEEVLQFRVADKCQRPDDLDLDKAFQSYQPDPRPKPSDATLKRRIYLIEDPPGTLTINGRLFHDRVEEVVHLGDTEIWEIVNTTADFHPFHIHLVDFEVFERQQFRYADGFDVDKWVAVFKLFQTNLPGVEPPGIVLTNQCCPIDDNEKGLKDTVRVGPMAVTRLVVKFGPHTGRYIYHCHILEHEDMEMMRPYLILPQGLNLMGPNPGPGTIPLPSAGAMSAKAMPTPTQSLLRTSPVTPGHGARMPSPKRTVRRRIPMAVRRSE
jgi:spore coat protein A